MAEKPIIARFSVSSLFPPKLTTALRLAERIHLALVSLSDGAKVFTGCDGSKKPLQGQQARSHSLLIQSGLGARLQG